MSNTEVYQQVTDELVKALEKGTVPWQRPWAGMGGLPLRMSGRKPYRGVNILVLWLTAQERGYSSPWWGTYRRIAALGGQVRRGERSTQVVLWKPVSRWVTTDGEAKRETYLLARMYRVFNAAQADWAEGMPEHMAPPAVLTEAQRIAAAEEIVAGYAGGPGYLEGAFAPAYDPTHDIIQLPPLAQFTSPAGYYSARFHEMAHSTGHRSRLDRKGATEPTHFGSALYGAEELTAQMGAAFLLAVAGLHDDTAEQSAAYLGSWIRNLKADPSLAVHAAAAASRAADWVLGRRSYDSEENGNGEE